MTEPGAAGALSRNVRFAGHTAMAGKADGVQVMVDRGFAYVGNLFSRGFSVVDVRDPRCPRPVSFVSSMEGCWSGHLQVHGDLLMVANVLDPFLSRSLAEPIGPDRPGEDLKGGSAQSLGGIRTYDVSEPGRPHQVGEMRVDGLGVHRIWYIGGDYAYVSALLNGYAESIFMVVDVSDPSQPHEVSRWWIPGMWSAAGETPGWPGGDRVACHHAIVAHDIAYVSWRDGGLTLLDVAQPACPTLITHQNWHPPFGGNTHTALPLTDRVPEPRPYLAVLDEPMEGDRADLDYYSWLLDVREPSNPVPVATFPMPSERDYRRHGGTFGPNTNRNVRL
jgi:hypothetical protein